MAAKKRSRLDATVRALQLRWGQHALRRGADVARETLPHVPTGFPALDKALTIRGLPRGHITELLAAPTAGMATLALKTLANAQAQGDTAVVIDMSHTFDGEYAVRCGVDLDRLLLARPRDAREALDLVHTLLARGAVGYILFDAVTDMLPTAMPPTRMDAALRRIHTLLARTRTALVFLTPLWFGPATGGENYPPGFALPHVAALRLHLTRQAWLCRGRTLQGWKARVHVLKNRFGPTGQTVDIAITFNGTVRGMRP